MHEMRMHCSPPSLISWSADGMQRFDAMGVDSIWNWDHFFPLTGDPQGNHYEAWTMLGAMATLTKQAEIGCLVSCIHYRNPALL